MSTLLVACPSCGKTYKLPSSSLGRQVRCKCGHAWKVPLAPPSGGSQVDAGDQASGGSAADDGRPPAAPPENANPQAINSQPVKPLPVKPLPVKPLPVGPQGSSGAAGKGQVDDGPAEKAEPPACVVTESPGNTAGVKAAARAAGENSGAKANEEARKLIGRELGNFRIDSLLGVGGFGAVYRAFDKSLHRDVALKVLPLALARAGRDKVQRFLQEARSAAKLSHPNVVTVHQICQIEEVYFIVMELVEGQSLADILRTRRLPATEATRIMTEAARGLAHAHRRGLIHRDIKPGNIMVTGDGLVKMTDFGLARDIFRDTDEDEIGRAVGTPLYMSPEQCEGEEGDSRSDVYSMAATYYVALTRRPPYEGSDSQKIMHRHRTEAPPDPRVIIPELPAAVFRIIEKGMAKEPAERYQTAEEMLKAIEGLDFASLDPNAHLSLEAVSAQISGVTPQVGSHVGQALKGIARRVDRSTTREPVSEARSIFAGPLKWYVIGGAIVALISIAAIVLAVVLSLQGGDRTVAGEPKSYISNDPAAGQGAVVVQNGGTSAVQVPQNVEGVADPAAPVTPADPLPVVQPAPAYDPAREAFEEAQQYAERIWQSDLSEATRVYRQNVISVYPNSAWAEKAAAEIEKLLQRAGQGRPGDVDGESENGAASTVGQSPALAPSAAPIDAMAMPVDEPANAPPADEEQSED